MFQNTWIASVNIWKQNQIGVVIIQALFKYICFKQHGVKNQEAARL